MKLVVTGYGQHGKDTVCEILRDTYGMKFVSSSFFVAVKVVRPWFEKRGRFYTTLDEMYADRVNWRPEWKQAIAEYNTPNPARLGTELFDEGNDIYCGLREIRELDALRKLYEFDLNGMSAEGKRLLTATVWVDASQRVPREPETSITITQADCDYVIDNNGPLEELTPKVTALYLMLKGLA